MLDRESIMFMRRSLAAGRVADGIRPVARACRRALFRLRKSALAARPGPQPEQGQVPPFLGERAGTDAPPPGLAHVLDDRRRILADAAAQAAGVVRLAGGRMHRLAGGTLEGMRDPEDRHAYHRLYWLLRLAKASYCGDGSAGFVKAWRGWYSDASRRGREALAPYSTGERICSLEEALFWTASANLGPTRTDILDQIWTDAWRLNREVEYSLGVHNHVLQNGRALLRAGRCFGQEGRAFRDHALEIGERFWPVLVDADGVLREQSSHYHVLLSRAALDYLYLAGSPPGLSPNVVSRLKRMFDLTNDLVRGDAELPRFGDSSPDATAADLRGLSRAAWSLGAMARPPRDRAFTTLTLYYSASESEEVPAPTSALHRVYLTSGFSFLRSADGRLEAAIHADPRPEAFGHGNCARGAFELCWDGTPLIREPGAFRDSSHPRYSRQRSPQGHNVCSIDNLPPALDADAERRFPAWYGNGGGAVRLDSDGSLRYVWRGFQRSCLDVSMERRWRVSNKSGFHFEERIGGGGHRRFQSRLHLGDVRCSELAYTDGRYRLVCSGLAGSFAVVFTIDMTAALQVSLEPAWVTSEYGVDAPSAAIAIEGTVELPYRWGLEAQVLDLDACDVPMDWPKADAVSVETY